MKENKMNRERNLNTVVMKLIVTLLLIAFFTGSSSASPTTYFGEDLSSGGVLLSHPNADAAKASFYAQLLSTDTEDFESFSDGDNAPINVIFPSSGTAAIISGTGEIEDADAISAGRYPISGLNFWEASSGANAFAIDFNQSQVAFGFYGIDIGDFQGQLTIEYTNGAVETVNVPHTVGAPSGSVLYFGFIDIAKPFDRIEFSNTGSSADYFGFDDFTIGTREQVIPPGDPAIPEFPTIAIPMIAILGLAFIFQRRND